MSKILGMEPHTAKIVGIAVLGVGGLYLLTHRGTTGQDASETALPITGPPQLGDQTPHGTSNYFDQNEQVAHQLSKDESFLLKRMQQDQAGLVQSYQQQGPPVISKAWQQVQGGWLGIKADNAGRFLGEDQAMALGPQNKGPYAQASGGFFGQLFKNLGAQIGTNLGQTANAYVGYELGQIPQPPVPKPKQPAYTPTYNYGNTQQAPPYSSRF